MHLAAVARGGGAVDPRAHEGMREAHPQPELDQTGGLGGATGLAGEPEPIGRPPHQPQVADRLGRGHQQQQLRFARKRLGALQEGALDPVRQGACIRQSEPARQLGRRQPARQLQEGERVAAGLGDDPVAHALVQRPEDRGAQQRPGVGVGQPSHMELRQAGERVVARRLADGEHHRHALGQQTPGDEREHQRRRPIEPLRIVDHAHERARLGGLGEQAQDRQRDQEAVRRRAVLEAERHLQRGPLRRRQRLQTVGQRRAQVMQTGERELHLRLHAGRPCDATSGGLPGDVFQQRRLADPRLAAQHQRRALADSDALQQPVERLAF